MSSAMEIFATEKSARLRGPMSAGIDALTKGGPFPSSHLDAALGAIGATARRAERINKVRRGRELRAARATGWRRAAVAGGVGVVGGAAAVKAHGKDEQSEPSPMMGAY